VLIAARVLPSSRASSLAGRVADPVLNLLGAGISPLAGRPLDKEFNCSLKLDYFLDYLIVWHASNRNGRVTRNDNSIRHIARDYGASSDQGILSDRHSRT
jgi:hypothetical protein